MPPCAPHHWRCAEAFRLLAGWLASSRLSRRACSGKKAANWESGQLHCALVAKSTRRLCAGLPQALHQAMHSGTSHKP
ncbi:hypothetical protein LX32DRAFT_333011 [Colletotrichum zoysiae]|uniref:Secreted protein n=1 Tax=Colletotrichum zoysiae TaxID=1216348 RepID=A0AAD9M5Y5_9PEZI|nr:hypothetical protein LX32DRAFT_333011 [Colletotrichum zoysiae]